MNASIDKNGCIGCGLCAGICPEVFSMASDGLAEVTASPTPDTLTCAKEAAESCPAAVITVNE